MCRRCQAITDRLHEFVTVFVHSGGAPTAAQLVAVGHRSRDVDVALTAGARLAYQLLAGIAAHAEASETEVWQRLMLHYASTEADR